MYDAQCMPTDTKAALNAASGLISVYGSISVSAILRDERHKQRQCCLKCANNGLTFCKACSGSRLHEMSGVCVPVSLAGFA